MAVLPVALLLTAGCVKPKDDNSPNVTPGAPTVVTLNATNVTAVSASIGGKVTSKGACTVLSSGVAISTSPTPTINNDTYVSTTPDDTATFSFTAAPLLPNTQYYARAYAVNCKGINYGNEITFITSGGGGGGTDTGYFNLIVDGVSYSADDLFGPNANHVFPEGDQRYAILTLDSSTGEFAIAAQSTYINDDAKSSGFSFQILYKPISGIGTYNFNCDASGEKSAIFQKRNNTGPSDPTTNNFDQYTTGGNAHRSPDGTGGCDVTSVNCANNTIQITNWQEPGGFIQGTFIGTVYENTKTDFACQNSTSHNYSGSFKLKRLQ